MNEEGYTGAAIRADVKINLNGLVQIDEKLSMLGECIKKGNILPISQICSDWWELTDEEEYAVAQFAKTFNDERAQQDLTQMMMIEILSIAIINYYTSSPELFRPSNI